MKKEDFDDKFKELNNEQREAVKDINDNLLVLSPAGTGKTKTIASRCENIIMNGIKAENIMCLTFTNKACAEMKERIVKSLGQDGEYIYIRTFHSFCFDVIKEEAKESTDISSDFLVFDEEDSREIIKEINKRSYPSRILENFIYEVKHFSLKTDYGVRQNYKKLVELYFKENMDAFRKNFRKNDPIECLNSLVKYGHILLKKYNDILKERHGLDFSDLVVTCYEIFENEDVLNKWRDKYSYIQVDEIQDTSILEYSIIKKIAFNKNLCFFGDTNQTIYGWRGSKPFDILNDFKDKFGPVKEIHLLKNYRSTENLLGASCSYLNRIGSIYVDEGIYTDVPKSYSHCLGDKIEYRSYDGIDDEGMDICRIIKNNYMDRLNKIAILTRNNELNKKYSAILESQSIPAFLVDEYKFFRRKEIKDVLAFLKLALNKYDVNSMKRIAFEFISGIGDKSIEYIEKKENKALGIRLTDFIEKSTIEHGDPYYELLESINDGNVVIFDVESTGVDVNSDEIVQIAAIKLDGKGSYEKFERFLNPSKSVGDSEKVHGFSDEFLKENGMSSRKALAEFLDFIDSSVIVGHNVQYDLSIMKSELSRLQMKSYNIKNYYDTLDMARKLLPELPNHKLCTISDYIKADIPPDHNAMNDILATKDVLLYLAKKMRDTSIVRMRTMSPYKRRFSALYDQMTRLNDVIDSKRPSDALKCVYDMCEIESHYKDIRRMDNLNELMNFFKNNDNGCASSRDALRSLLTITSLSNSEIDGVNRENKVPIITVHQGKGLEFEAVFLPSLDEGDFPSYFSKSKSEMVEECRLFYVAMTRAKERLYLSSHRFDGRRKREKSRFLSYIDKRYIDER